MTAGLFPGPLGAVDGAARRGWAGDPRGFGALLRRPTFVLSVLVLACWIVIAVCWRWLGIDPYADTGVRLSPPSAEYWFGTDRIGRDVAARVLAGAEPALLIGPVGALIAMVLGCALGLIAGYRRGWVDQLLMRIFDVFFALPAIVLLLVVVAAFGSLPWVLMLSIGLLFAPGIARVVRAAVIVEMGKDYVTSARVQGEHGAGILTHELLPNVWPQVVVQGTLSIASAVFVAASLSFLGLAAAPPSPDWGLAVNENRAYLRGAWWTLLFPSLAIASLVVSIALIGDHLREWGRR